MASGSARMRYKSALTDNGNWDRFGLRPGDVVITTPPKCGTTWTQSLTLCLIFDRPGMDNEVDDHSIWLDPGFRDQAGIERILDAQTHRRCIKTHTPRDGIAFRPDVRYVAVYRHPLDAHFSMRRHAANVKIDVLDGRFAAGDAPETFRLFLETPPANQMGDGITLASIAHHLKGMLEVAGHPNVLLLHYADMTRDLAGAAARLSAHLGYDYAPDRLAAFAESLKFATVQANARARVAHNPRSTATFHDPAAFFDSGTSRKWEGRLSESEVAAYRDRLAELLPPGAARWLERGGPLPAP